jgi:hypothetical protein
MAAAACLRWAQIANSDREAVHSGVSELLVGAR